MKLALACALILFLSVPTFPEGAMAQSIEQLSQQADTALKNNQRQEAEAIWRTVLRRDPKNTRAYIGLGDALRYRKRDQEAIKAYQKAIELDPQQVAGYLALADLLRLDQPEAAILVYRRAIQVAAPSAEVYYRLGVTLSPAEKRVSQKQKDEAIESFRKAIEIDPKLSKAYVALGNQLEFDQLDKAMAAYRSAMELDDSNAYFIYGRILASQKRSAEMIPLYQQAIQRNPKGQNVITYYGGLASTFEELNQLDQAADIYRKVLQLRPNDPIVYFRLGDILQKQGQSDQAVSLYRKAAELIRADSYSSRASSYSYRMGGNQLQDRGQYDLAIALYRKAIALDRRDAFAYALIADTLHLQGKPDEAIQTYRQSISVNPEFAYAYGGLGRVLQQQGKLDQAAQAYREARSLNPKDSSVQKSLIEVEALLRSRKQSQKFTGEPSILLPSESSRQNIREFTGETILPQSGSSQQNVQAGFQFQDSEAFNQGKLVTLTQEKQRQRLEALGHCMGYLYVPPTYRTVTTVEKTPGKSTARFFSKTAPPAAGLRVIIRNATSGINQTPSPYTDRGYDQGDLSESFVIQQNTAHDSRYFAMISGLNTLTYEIKRGNEVLETGTFTVMMTPETREQPPDLEDSSPKHESSNQCDPPKLPEPKLPEVPPLPKLPPIPPEIQQMLDQYKK
ncbi:TPR repeat-containing protein [Leptolyngbya sp. NIES-3755]|nr:TPR repeat-containing protein [Leptolyngbya sp. NIES-3755]